MKKLILALILVVMALPAMAQDHSHEQGDAWLRPVEAQYVCMVNDRSFDTPQISVEVEGKTYYGCCPMCKERLTSDSAMRSAIDPVSGNAVDKADAIIGTDAGGTVYYFENAENFHSYAGGPAHGTEAHGAMHMMDEEMPHHMEHNMEHMHGHGDNQMHDDAEQQDGHH